MSASDIKQMKNMARTGFLYLFCSMFCILFGAVYESFSHEVYSFFMLYAFVFPLAGGALPFFAMAFSGMASGRLPVPGRTACSLYHSGIAALTTGSLVKGALEIYGTTNRLVSVYWILGILFLLTGVLLYFFCSGKTDRCGRPKQDEPDI